MKTKLAKAKKKILVVDDEDDLRGIEVLLLRHAGFEVWEASNGVEGLQCLLHEPFDLVVTDIAMPLKDGLAMIEAAQTLAPDVDFIVYSGSVYDDPGNARRLNARNIRMVLSKPTSVSNLARAIHETLSRKSLGAPRQGMN